MKQRIISFHYTLTDPQGQTLDTSANREPLSFLEGTGQIIPGLETQLGKLKTGDKQRLAVKAQDAYGLPDPAMIMEIPRNRLPSEQVKVGDRFRSGGHPTPLTVTKVTPTHVTLDANHPLAGMDLIFDVEVTGMREATEKELAGAHECCGNHAHGCCGEKHEEHSHGSDGGCGSGGCGH